MNNQQYRPLLRLYQNGDKPRPLELRVNSCANGYILSVAWNGGNQTLVCHSMENVIEWLREWDMDNGDTNE